MPYEIKLENLPVGVAVSAAKSGEKVAVQYRGIATSEDGELLVRYLGFADSLLAAIAQVGPQIRASQVDNLAAIIRTDKSATVYVNELKLITSCRPARTVPRGEALTKDDIIELREAEFEGVTIPSDAGTLLICSSGWRKGIFFDFGPLCPDLKTPREYSPWQKLGEILARMFFQERFAITHEDWSALFAAHWFPFAGLRNDSIDKLLSHVRTGWGVQDLLPEFEKEISSKVDGFAESWSSNPTFLDHMQLLRCAVDRFQAGDYASCLSIIVPKIEGLIRSHHIRTASPGGRGQSELADVAVASLINDPYSLLLPQRFHEYLRTCYFASFDESSAQIPFSRNSVGHGVARDQQFNVESALIAILVCHQLYYCISTPKSHRSN